ncbi:MAG TPA: hypothetical protein VF393_04915 [archaeon]
MPSKAPNPPSSHGGAVGAHPYGTLCIANECRKVCGCTVAPTRVLTLSSQALEQHGKQDS